MEVDIVAVGSGIGASCTAIAAHAQGLDTVILEKSNKFGGGTTYSYGIVWVGDNHLERALGIQDSKDEAYEYLHHLAAGHEIESTSGPTSNGLLKRLGSSVTKRGYPSTWSQDFPITSNICLRAH